jgi:Zn-dependent protease with chaperone function
VGLLSRKPESGRAFAGDGRRCTRCEGRQPSWRVAPRPVIPQRSRRGPEQYFNRLLAVSASVRLNDNLLRRSSPAEIRAVMAHELGHNVMNHIYRMLAELTLLVLTGFVLAKWAIERLLARYGARLGLQGVADVASLPLPVAVFSVLAFLATPIHNASIRAQ